MSYRFLLVILDSINSFLWPLVPFGLLWSIKKYITEENEKREFLYMLAAGVCILLLIELVIVNVGTNTIDIWNNDF